VRTENQPLLNVICWLDVFLLIGGSHLASDKTCTISQNFWQENFLPICNNIRVVVPIEIQAFFVRNVLKTFKTQPATGRTQRNAMGNFELNARE
jgi:hypothetical protein